MMKLSKVFIVAAVVLLAAGTALANDPKVVFDPVQATQLNGAYLIQQMSVQYSVSWGSCAAAQILDPTAFATTTSCIYFINETGQPISDLMFTFGIDSMSAGPFGCTSADGFLSNNTCPSSASAGDMVTAEFNGGNPIPYTPFPSPTMFIIGESGVADPNTDFPTTAQVPTHDPSTLLLLATGTVLLGFCCTRRYA